MKSFPETLALTNVEAVIVDAAMLRDYNGLTAREVRAAQGWKLPTVWIDEAATLPAPARETWVQLKPPIYKDELQRSLVSCLGGAGASKQNTNAVTGRTETPARSNAKKSKAPVATADAAFIELTEVVEDEQEQDRR
jgi:hypothetical protein